jgi:hypothetical protein
LAVRKKRAIVELSREMVPRVTLLLTVIAWSCCVESSADAAGEPRLADAAVAVTGIATVAARARAAAIAPTAASLLRIERF